MSKISLRKTLNKLGKKTVRETVEMLLQPYCSGNELKQKETYLNLILKTYETIDKISEELE